MDGSTKQAANERGVVQAVSQNKAMYIVCVETFLDITVKYWFKFVQN